MKSVRDLAEEVRRALEGAATDGAEVAPFNPNTVWLKGHFDLIKLAAELRELFKSEVR